MKKVNPLNTSSLRHKFSNPGKITSKFSKFLGSIITLILTAVLLPPTILLSPQLEATAYTIRYVPPPHGDARRTEGSGSRGCGKDTISFNLIIPSDHVPQTVSSHPSFFWYMSEVTAPVRFTLVEQGVSKTLIDNQFRVEKPGIVQMQLPADSPGLEVSKKYRWTVSIVCNPVRHSENSYTIGWISRVPVSPELSKKLATATNNHLRAAAYAESGIWYDALSSSYYSNNTDYFISLMEQIGLNDLTQKIRAISKRYEGVTKP